MILIIAGVLFVLYFLCIALFIGHGTNFYFVWLFMGVILIAFGFCLKKELLSHIPVVLRRTGILFFCAAALVFLIAEGCIISGFMAKGAEKLDVILVLGAQMKTEGPSRVLRMRLDKACDYLADNPGTRVIVSGGQGSDEPVSEAQGMYDYLVGRGVPAACITMEDESRNTRENISFSSEYLNMEKDSVGIVTNNFHVFRATHIAEKYGYQKVCGIAAPSEILMQPNNMLREFFGVIKDFLVGNM